MKSLLKLSSSLALVAALVLVNSTPVWAQTRVVRTTAVTVQPNVNRNAAFVQQTAYRNTAYIQPNVYRAPVVRPVTAFPVTGTPRYFATANIAAPYTNPNAYITYPAYNPVAYQPYIPYTYSSYNPYAYTSYNPYLYPAYNPYAYNPYAFNSYGLSGYNPFVANPYALSNGIYGSYP